MPKVPVAMEKTGDRTTAEESQRSIPTPFLTKTYQLVDDRSLDDMISWNEDGTAFIVWQPAEFARDLLPKFFKHNNFSSFIRQLNTYGFRKIVSDRWEFAHDCFRKDKKSLLRQIQRRKFSPQPITPAQPPAVTAAVPLVAVPIPTSSPANSSEELVVSSNSSPLVTAARSTICTPTTELVEENERLREENAHLRQELDDLRGLCSNVVSLMSNFTSNRPAMDINRSEETAVNGGRTGVQEEEDACPRLFGVPIGVRRSEIGTEDEVLQSQRFRVKSEPSN